MNEIKTVKDVVIEQSVTRQLTAAKKRLEDLERLGVAPLVKRQKEVVASLEAGELPQKVNGLDEFGDLELVDCVTVKSGRGGKKYLEMTTSKGVVRYFPLGKYGPFLKMA